ncbi:MAG: 30S ribosomal protein S12 methylthiotransferase RimO [Myxococcales bacterium]|nr:30S ribosomal protein S12 methylthiotransferase RimO [Myxococcales bacterium]MCB9707494.1 30S ribosomal protein S12 methylthiotransferase RimO [Myxococcales bacterium]
MSLKTVHFISLGCPKNRVDTEVMLGVSEASGLALVAEPEDAEVIVINTCGFIDRAKEESIDTILEMARYKIMGKCQRLVVAGCLSQRYSKELALQLPEVDHFLGSSDMLRLREVLATSAPRILVGNPADYLFQSSDPRRISTRIHSVFVKIAEGCNRTCSFCAIPSIRGKQRSRPVFDIVQEIHTLVERGSVEVNLISQDTIAYGRDLDPRASLSELLRSIAAVEQLRWLRLFYLYPETLTSELLDLFTEHPSLVPYIDMPLQHASDAMLRRMRRGHGGDRLYRVVEHLRNRISDLTLRTAFILGHPGETDKDFKELCNFVEWAGFDSVGVFLYSSEHDTPSGHMADPVPAEIAQRRADELMAIQRSISKRKQEAFIGQRIEVLVDGPSDESQYLLEGRHRGQAPDIDGKVYLANGAAKPGELIEAKVTAAADYDLLADILTQSRHRGSQEKPQHQRLPVVMDG